MLVCHFVILKKFSRPEFICILNNNSEYEEPVSTPLYRSVWIKVTFFSLADVEGGGGGGGVHINVFTAWRHIIFQKLQISK